MNVRLPHGQWRRPSPGLRSFACRVAAGTLTITGDSASDKLALRLVSGSPNSLAVDVGDDGSADFTFDRTTFTDTLDGNDNVLGPGE